MARRILVVTGASGVGKTTIVKRLAERRMPGVLCAFFDSIGVPPRDKMPADWQEQTTNAWIARLAHEHAEIAVLDGQTRPTFVLRALADAGVRGGAVLVDCGRAVREARLVARGQPELASDEMQAWAAYLRRQADALALPVVDTNALGIEQATDALVSDFARLG